jgi:hypothetical protein
MENLMMRKLNMNHRTKGAVFLKKIIERAKPIM